MSGAALVGVSAAGGALSGAASALSQMYQWQQMLEQQKMNQNFMREMLKTKQNFARSNILLQAQLRGINVPSSILARNTVQQEDSNSIGSATDLMQDHPEAFGSGSVNNSNHVATNANEFPASGPYQAFVPASESAAPPEYDSSTTTASVSTDNSSYKSALSDTDADSFASAPGDSLPDFSGVQATGPPNESAFPSKNVSSTPTDDYVLSRQFTPSSENSNVPRPIQIVASTSSNSSKA